MKKTYTSPEFDLLAIAVTDVICDSRTEGGGGGGDWGDPSGGDPSED